MPLPPGARPGTLPNGTLVWVDAQGQPLNPDGSPMTGQTATPLPPTAATRPSPATLPLPPAGTPAPATSDSNPTLPASGVNIAPAGSGAAPATTTPATATTSTAPAAGPTQAGTPGSTSQGYSIAQILAPSDDEFRNANQNVNDVWAKINGTAASADGTTPAVQGAAAKVEADKTAGLDGSSPTAYAADVNALNQLYGTLSSAEQRIETANAARNTLLTNAIHNGTIDPSQVRLATEQAKNYDASATQANAQAKVLLDGADTQRQYVSAQAASASQDALLKQAQTDAQNLKNQGKGPDAELLLAQAGALQSQKNQTDLLLPGLLKKQQDDSTLTLSQAGLNDANSQLSKANVTKTNAEADLTSAEADYQRAQGAAGIPAATAAELGGRAAQEQATAAQTLADIQAKKLGPTYGLQDQLNAIKSIHDQVFGPGGSGTPDQRRQQADDLLNQFFTATVGGTTPYAASVAAANAGLTAYGTQMSGVNALQAAQTGRASAYAGLAGSELGTLAGMNAYAPKGSTAMAGAFQYLQDDMAKRMATQFPTAPIPNAPALPAYLQQFGAPAQAGPGGAALPAGPPVAAAGVPGAGPAAVPGGQGPVFNPQASTAAMNTAGFLDSPAGRAAMAASNPALLGSPAGSAASAPVPAPAAGAAPGGPPASLPGMFTNYWQQQYPSAVGQPATGPVAGMGGLTPAQAFGQGFTSNVPTFPNVLQMYGLNLPNPTTMLGGQPYMGMGV